MITQEQLRQVLTVTFSEKLEGIFGRSIDIYILGLNEKTKRLHWLAFNPLKQKVLYEQMRQATNLWQNNPIEIPARTIRGKGLVAAAYEDKQVVYTSDAAHDDRSREPNIFDKRLKFKSALYIPLQRFGFEGVLLINSPKRQLRIDDTLVSDINYRTVAFDKISVLETYIKSILKELFADYIKSYLELSLSFDSQVLAENENECFLDLRETVADLLHVRTPPDEAVSSFLENSPAFPLISNLRSLERFVGLEESLRRHYHHAFHVFCLGNRLIRVHLPLIRRSVQRDSEMFNELLGTSRFDFGSFADEDWQRLIKAIWFIVSTCHDIGLPIEKTDDWIRQFYRNYFPNEEVDFLVSRRQYFHLYDFPKYRNLIILYLQRQFISGKLLGKKTTYLGHILSDIIDYKLSNRSDHAVLSAYITMDLLEKLGKKCKRVQERLKRKLGKRVLDFIVSPAGFTIVGASILLHRFHKWKDYPYSESHKIESFGGFKTMKQRSLIEAAEARRIYDAYKEQVVLFKALPFAFVLTFCDIIQEWGREPTIGGKKSYKYKSLKPYVKKLESHRGTILMKMDAAGPPGTRSEQRDRKLRDVGEEMKQFRRAFSSGCNAHDLRRKFKVKLGGQRVLVL